MEGFLTMKGKRKELDDFSDFSLSSPACKIRRLDAEIPPIIEEEEQDIPHLVYEQLIQEKNQFGPPVVDELPSEPVNDERSIVLFKPVNTPLVASPPSFSVSVDSGFLSGFRNQIMWSCQPDNLNSREDETAALDNNNNNGPSTNGCTAVVPWVPSQIPTTSAEVGLSQPEDVEWMEADEMGEATMEIEENIGSIEPSLETESSEMRRWQHCMTRQLPEQNPSTSIVWY